MDRTTKTILIAIAAGLWLNLASDWLRPVAVHAQGGNDLYLSFIESHLAKIARGTCSNPKLC